MAPPSRTLSKFFTFRPLHSGEIAFPVDAIAFDLERSCVINRYFAHPTIAVLIANGLHTSCRLHFINVFKSAFRREDLKAHSKMKVTPPFNSPSQLYIGDSSWNFSVSYRLTIQLSFSSLGINSRGLNEALMNFNIMKISLVNFRLKIKALSCLS
jgi:hypothetical protein